MEHEKDRGKVWTWILAISFGFLCAGCGSGMVPVQGRVTLDGQPLGDATVTFVPVDSSGRSAAAPTEKDGTFVLSTLKAGDGIAPGSYKVTVSKSGGLAASATGGQSPPGIPSAEMMKATAERMKQQQGNSPVPAIYGDPATTPLTEEIPRGGKQDVEIKLDSKAGSGK